jgi:hypothetical protein
MDVLYFLNERTKLIRHFYDSASAPFLETKRAIDAQDPPFDNPPYDESGEPPFLGEWLQADVELELAGRACVSMLSEALKQFFVTWERHLWGKPPPCRESFKAEFGNGFLAGYMACFGRALSFEPQDCPADLAVIEQVVLARNRTQHFDMNWPNVQHEESSRSKFPRPFFARDDEAWPDDGSVPFLGPWVHIGREKLFLAVDELERLGAWLQTRIEGHFFPPTASTT